MNGVKDIEMIFERESCEESKVTNVCCSADCNEVDHQGSHIQRDGGVMYGTNSLLAV